MDAEAARILFEQPCEFIWAADSIKSLPPQGAPEFAFAGRSNVGKSSLLNALTRRNTLARTSSTPGRTQQLNFFALGRTPETTVLRLVDMPGYGYAKVAQSKVDAWTLLMRDYMRGRATLKRVYILVDARHGLKPQDVPMMDDLDSAALVYQIVLTKADAVPRAALAATIAATEAAIAKRPAAHPQVLATSAEAKTGISELREEMAKLL